MGTKIDMKKNILILCIMALMSCDASTTMGTSATDNNSDGTGAGGNSGGNNTDLPIGFAKFFEDYTDVYISGDYVVVETTGVPNHSSPYWGTGHPNYSSPSIWNECKSKYNYCSKF